MIMTIVFTTSTTQDKLDDLVKRGVSVYILKSIDIDILHSKLKEIEQL